MNREVTPLRNKAKKYSYDQGYLAENITKVSLTFNRRVPEDMELMEWLKSKPEGRNQYIKRLLREDMERK